MLKYKVLAWFPFIFQFVLVDRIKKENGGANLKSNLVDKAPAHAATLSPSYTSLFFHSPLFFHGWFLGKTMEEKGIVTFSPSVIEESLIGPLLDWTSQYYVVQPSNEWLIPVWVPFHTKTRKRPNSRSV